MPRKFILTTHLVGFVKDLRILKNTQEHLILCKVLLNILPLLKHIEYNYMNGTKVQQVNFIQTYGKYLEDPDLSLAGLYSGPVRPQAASPGRPGRSESATVVQHILMLHF